MAPPLQTLPDMMPLIIFSDLDGTLLDHHSYSWAPARAAVEKISALEIPFILNTSKTISEVLEIRNELDNRHPFIIENGGAVCIPAGHPGHSRKNDEDDLHRFGKSSQEILQVLSELRNLHDFMFRGFSDMTTPELAELTGLTAAQAEMAKQRCCSEPILWTDSEKNFELFCSELEKQDLQVISGGRFFHIMGNTDKGVAMQWLLENVYQTTSQSDYTSIAFGDSPNDLPMLEQADYSVVINSGSGKSMLLNKIENVLYTEECGPAGWQIAFDKLLAQLGD